jgi:hypothetical protein
MAALSIPTRTQRSGRTPADEALSRLVGDRPDEGEGAVVRGQRDAEPGGSHDLVADSPRKERIILVMHSFGDLAYIQEPQVETWSQGLLGEPVGSYLPADLSSSDGLTLPDGSDRNGSCGQCRVYRGGAGLKREGGIDRCRSLRRSSGFSPLG